MYKPESPEEAEYLANYDPSKYAVTINTVDVIVHTLDHVLLIKRGGYPYKGYWALPGGFMNPNETAAQAAVRELQEETGIVVPEVEFLGIADNPWRDPRGRAISFVFDRSLRTFVAAVASDDAVEANWFHVDNLPSLAFDHADILKRYMDNPRTGARDPRNEWMDGPPVNDFGEDVNGDYVVMGSTECVTLDDTGDSDELKNLAPDSEWRYKNWSYDG